LSKNNVTPRSEAAPVAPVAGKGHATPSRKEREAANKRPLVPEDRAEARRQNRASVAEQRERARIGMAAGDERYLPARDRGPQKRYIRDYVDARYSVGELTIPFMVLVILTSFYQPLMEIGVIVMWSYLIIVIVDCSVMTFLLRRHLKTKFGSSERGVSWYASMRSIQLRPMRMPKPAVRRRQYPS
jgi:hypothetical protein